EKSASGQRQPARLARAILAPTSLAPFRELDRPLSQNDALASDAPDRSAPPRSAPPKAMPLRWRPARLAFFNTAFDRSSMGRSLNAPTPFGPVESRASVPPSDAFLAARTAFSRSDNSPGDGIGCP